MKSLIYCYVSERRGSNTIESVNYNEPNCLEYLDLRPVVVVNRRHNILNEKYLSAKEMREKYAAASILRRARMLIQHKKSKQRKDVKVEVIKKKNSKHNKVWNSLLRPIQSGSK